MLICCVPLYHQIIYRLYYYYYHHHHWHHHDHDHNHQHHWKVDYFQRLAVHALIVKLLCMVLLVFLRLRKKPQLGNISGLIWCTESNLNEGSGHEEFLRVFTSAEMLFHYICGCLLKNSLHWTECGLGINY
jgi:hypothetical protein